MEKISVGRAVHFYEADTRKQLVGPFAATVSGVHNSHGETVDLHVCMPDLEEPIDFVEEVQFSPEPKAGCWSWPPRV